jgi:hypothetical protein
VVFANHDQSVVLNEKIDGGVRPLFAKSGLRHVSKLSQILEKIAEKVATLPVVGIESALTGHTGQIKEASR